MVKPSRVIISSREQNCPSLTTMSSKKFWTTKWKKVSTCGKFDGRVMALKRIPGSQPAVLSVTSSRIGNYGTSYTTFPFLFRTFEEVPWICVVCECTILPFRGIMIPPPLHPLPFPQNKKTLAPRSHHPGHVLASGRGRATPPSPWPRGYGETTFFLSSF